MSTKNIFIGGSNSEYLPSKVLEFSIRKYTKNNYNIIHLNKVIDDNRIKSVNSHQKTPFSLQRFFIPELNNFRDNALYLDSDMLFFDDINYLTEIDMKDASIIAAKTEPKQSSLLIINCEKVKWDINEIKKRLQNDSKTYNETINNFIFKDTTFIIDKKWNSLDQYEENITSNIHFTNMIRQPWLSGRHKYLSIWSSVLFEALDSGFISKLEVTKEIQNGNVRPSLQYQVDKYESSYANIPSWEKVKDLFFFPPYIKNKFNFFK